MGGILVFDPISGSITTGGGGIATHMELKWDRNISLENCMVFRMFVKPKLQM